MCEQFLLLLFSKAKMDMQFLAASASANQTYFIVSSVCPNSASFFGFMGVVASLVFASKLFILFVVVVVAVCLFFY